MWRGERSLTSAPAVRGGMWEEVIEEDGRTCQMRLCLIEVIFILNDL